MVLLKVVIIFIFGFLSLVFIRKGIKEKFFKGVIKYFLIAYNIFFWIIIDVLAIYIVI